MSNTMNNSGVWGYLKMGLVAILLIVLPVSYFAVGVLKSISDERGAKDRIPYSPASADEIRDASADPCVKLRISNWLNYEQPVGKPRTDRTHHIRRMDLEEFVASCKANADSLAIAATQKQALEAINVKER